MILYQDFRTEPRKGRLGVRLLIYASILLAHDGEGSGEHGNLLRWKSVDELYSTLGRTCEEIQIHLSDVPAWAYSPVHFTSNDEK